MSQADTAAYFGAMAALRAEQPVYAGGGQRARHRDADLSGSDASYYDRCPQAWLDVDGGDDRASLDLIFPSEYFAWCQRYLLAAMVKRPGVSSSPEFKVTWAIDVWCHVHYALFALNVNWSAASPLWGEPALSGEGFVPQGQALLAMGYKPYDKKAAMDALGMLRASALSRADREGASAQILAQMRSAQLSVFALPLVDTLLPWCNFRYSRGPRDYNKLWPRLLQALQPWRSDFARVFQEKLPSKDSKDAADLRAFASDPPLLYAAMQWRLFSALDHNSQWAHGLDPARTLRGAGAGSLASAATLSQYISAVRGQPHGSDALYVRTSGGGAWFASVDFQLDHLIEQAGGIIRLDYRRAVSSYFQKWLTVHLPPFNAAGAPETNGQLVQRLGKDAPRAAQTANDSLARCPVTYVDWWQIWKKQTKEITEQLQRTAKDPSVACDRLANAAERKACKKAYGKFYSLPVVKQLAGAMGDVGAFIVGFLGGAIGAYDDPFYVVESPFGRNLTSLPLRLATDCSTADFGVRLGVAQAHAEELNPGLFSRAMSAAELPARDCMTYFYGPDSTPCTVCAGEAPPGCTVQLPTSYTGPRAGAGARPVDNAYALGLTQLLGPEMPPEVVRQSRAMWVQWISDNAQYADCMQLGDDVMWLNISRAVYNGKLTFEQGVVTWAGFITHRCGVRLPPQSAGRDSFFGRVLSPVNPLRWLGG